MTLLTFVYPTYTLQLELLSLSIKLSLFPSKSSAVPSYLYSATLDLSSIDSRLQIIFSSIATLWKYFTFHQDRALSIDFAKIEHQNETLAKDYQSKKALQIDDQNEVELPVSIRLIVIPDVENLIKINGHMIIDSLEEKYEQLLKESQTIKEQLASSLSKCEQLMKENKSLKELIENYEAEKLKVHQEYLPRKRTHTVEEIEEGQFCKDLLIQNIQHSPEEESKHDSDDNQEYLNYETEKQADTVEKRMVIFAQKCYMFVGYNDRSEERKGFVCIGCSKAFKEVSYLEKHLISKHSDLAQSSLSVLDQKLAQYLQKKNEDMKLENALKYYTASK